MSDLAVIDLDNPELSTTGVRATVVGPAAVANGSSAAASIASLTRGLSGIESGITDMSNTRALKRSLSGDGIVVVNPVLTSAEHNLGKLAILTIRAHLAGKPIALVGLSAHGLNSRRSRFLARTIVKSADLVLVRDEASADALMAAGVEPPFRMGADPAWAQLDELYAAKEQEDRLVVAVDTDTEKVIDLDSLTATLRSVSDSGVEVVLQPWNENGKLEANEKVAHRIASRLGGNASVATAPKSLREAREAYSSSRMVLSLRPQAVMAAAVAGSRSISLASEPTLGRLSDSLALPTLSTNASASVLTTAVLEALDSEPAAAAAVRQHIDRAKGSVALVRLLLTEGADVQLSTIDPLPLYPNPWR